MRTTPSPLNRLLMGAAVMSVAVFINSTAWAATLKQTSLVNDTHLRLGHVFDGVEKHADFILGPAPAPGATIVLNAQTLNHVAASFGLEWRAAHPYEQLVVERAATVINTDDMAQTLRQHFETVEFLRDFRIDVSNSRQTIVIPDNFGKTLTLTHMDFDKNRLIFNAELQTEDGGKHRIQGRLVQMTEIPVITSKKRAGDIITAADIAWMPIEQSLVNPNMIIDGAQLIGMTPRRMVNENTPLRLNEMTAPIVVKKGDVITVALDTGRIQLVSKGRALDNGSKGDIIRIVNPSSNRVIEARVTDAQTVQVTPGMQAAF